MGQGMHLADVRREVLHSLLEEDRRLVGERRNRAGEPLAAVVADWGQHMEADSISAGSERMKY